MVFRKPFVHGPATVHVMDLSVLRAARLTDSLQRDARVVGVSRKKVLGQEMEMDIATTSAEAVKTLAADYNGMWR